MHRKTSGIWSLFRPVDDIFAVCNICEAKLSYKTTTSNLTKHLRRMHPTCALPGHSTRLTYLALKDSNAKSKHRNSAQERILVDYLKSYPVLLGGPSKENRIAFESLWRRLSSELNNHGPPEKDINGWKKSLKDWKLMMKKKIYKNRLQNNASYKEFNSTEEAFATLLNMNEDINYLITEASSDDDYRELFSNKVQLEVEEDVAAENAQAELLARSDETCNQGECSTGIGDEENPHTVKTQRKQSTDMMQLGKIDNKISLVQDTVNEMRVTLNEFCVLYKQKVNEDQRHHLQMEKLLAEKNELKRLCLEFGRQKNF